MSGSGDQPLVSILMVARNTGPFIDAAIASARAQTYANLDIVVVDDASTDDTRTIAERHAAADARVRVLDGPRAGLAAVRNASLAAARGKYAAILDSDDLMHPAHVSRLVAAARETGAEMIVANMVEFGDAGRRDETRLVRLFARGRDWIHARPIRIDDYVRGNVIGAEVVLGYLKPLFDMEFLRSNTLAYDPGLRIGEDFDLVFRAMLAGGRLHYLPEPGYFYRRHAASTSARTPLSDLEAQLASDARYVLPDSYPLLAARGERRRAARAALRMTRAVEALKARRPVAGLVALGGDRWAWKMMAQAARDGIGKRCRRLLSRRRAGSEAVPMVLVLGDPPADGDAAARIDALRERGMVVTRIPVDAIGPEMMDGLACPIEIVVVDDAAARGLAWTISPAAKVTFPHRGTAATMVELMTGPEGLPA